MSNNTSIRFTASIASSIASGEIGGAFLPRPLLAVISASSKNLRRPCAQQGISVTGPGNRPTA